MNFYTNVSIRSNNIQLCGYLNGKRYYQKIRYKPYLFVPTKKESKYKTIHGQLVDRMNFESISDARDFYKQYEDVDGFNIYGLNQFQYTYIYDNFRNTKFDTSLIKIAYLDIEVDSEESFPDIELANNKITAITMMYKDKTFAFGYGDFQTKDNTVYYFKCKDEIDLLRKFIQLWSSDLYRPDVVTGWNIEFFDIPYLVNRIIKLLGEDYVKKLSPWNNLEERTVDTMGKLQTVYVPTGISILDYIQLYKKFTYTEQDSYKLDHICFVELGEKKTDYSEYKTLASLYRNNHQLFMEYNIRDCTLVMKLENKMKLLELVFIFAYDSGINYVDALTSVRTWDIIIHNYLMDRNIVIPKKEKKKNNRHPVGGHVKEPQKGLHDWIVSYDLVSMYPKRIIESNISPDTILRKKELLNIINE